MIKKGRDDDYGVKIVTNMPFQDIKRHIHSSQIGKSDYIGQQNQHHIIYIYATQYPNITKEVRLQTKRILM